MVQEEFQKNIKERTSTQEDKEKHSTREMKSSKMIDIKMQLIKSVTIDKIVCVKMESINMIRDMTTDNHLQILEIRLVRVKIIKIEKLKFTRNLRLTKIFNKKIISSDRILRQELNISSREDLIRENLKDSKTIGEIIGELVDTTKLETKMASKDAKEVSNIKAIKTAFFLNIGILLITNLMINSNNLKIRTVPKKC